MHVRLHDINKTFGRNHVVRSVDLTVPERQFVTLLGPSGCGKTTLLRMIAGLESISSGALWFGERRVNHLRPAERNVAMVFQNYALYPNMNVAANIGYGLRVRGMPRADIRARVAEVAEILEIGHLLNRKPRALSGGQRQRVALGRAMVRDPSIFLMDEPLSNLDAKLRATMRSELKRFHLELETTTIYVTHDQLEAMTMSDRVAVMQDGMVQQYATPQEVYNRPANRFVAGFIGSPPMNMVDGVLAHEDGVRVRLGGGWLGLPAGLAGALGDRPSGGRVTVGIRPQDLAIGRADDDGTVADAADDRLRLSVELVELIGSEQLVELGDGGTVALTAEIRADQPVAVGDVVDAVFDRTRLHLFDPDTGVALR